VHRPTETIEPAPERSALASGGPRTAEETDRLAPGAGRAAALESVIGAIAEGVAVCAADGTVTLTNPAIRSILGRRRIERLDDITDALHDPDDRAQRTWRQGRAVELPMHADRERWIELVSYPVRRPPPDMHGEPMPAAPDLAWGMAHSVDTPQHLSAPSGASDDDGAGTIVVLRDITERRRREAIRETFVGVLSHELRTPVTTIYGGAKLLARRDSVVDAATRQAIFEDIVAEAERLHLLVEDVVAMNRFGESSDDMGSEPVLVQRVVPAVIAIEEARWPGVRFEMSLPPGVPTVIADRVYLEQILRNLVANAAKYGGPESHVTVVVEPTEDEVHLRVLDDGPGIDSAEAERLFELFYRSESTSRRTAGAGIGLFVCARLVRAMGGRIWGRPRPAGGAEFGVALRRMADDERRAD
jgi:signal transduction histidine kinase